MPLSSDKKGVVPGHQRTSKVDLQNNQKDVRYKSMKNSLEFKHVPWSLEFGYFLCSTAVCNIIRQSLGCVVQIVVRLPANMQT